MTQHDMHRLAPDPAHSFSGGAISRGQPIHFSFEGRSVEGFQGDTVLSALLAAGYRSVGEADGAPLALSPQFAPLVIDMEAPNRLANALDRIPVRNGARYILQAKRPAPFWKRMFGHNRALKDLGVACTDRSQFSPPHLLREPPVLSEFDCVVVGGGLAGMAAAVEAAKHGSRVALVERRGLVGGDALLFGNRAGEPDAEDQVEVLAKAIARDEAITVFLLCEAIAVSSDGVLVQFGKDTPKACKDGVGVLAFKNMVLATGCSERLPIYPGNRLPGTSGLSDAFHLAHAYGVWPGRRVLICGGSNLIYRMGMLANDAGVQVEKLGDPRLDPRSRFLDFSKACGLRMEAGVRVKAAQCDGERLIVTLGTVGGGPRHRDQTLEVDRVIATDGWLPRLGLWRQAGGGMAWSDDGHLVAMGAPSNVALAGSAAGYERSIACIQSGIASVQKLWGELAGAIEDEPLPEIYESRALSAKPANLEISSQPIYLTRDANLLRVNSSHGGKMGAEQAHFGVEGLRGAFSMQGIDALCRLGMLSPDLVDIVAQERNLAPTTLRSGQPLTPRGVKNDLNDTKNGVIVPGFLAGRFGPHPKTCVLEVATQLPECGALIFANSDPCPPNEAVGVVLGVLSGRAVALLRGDFAAEERNLVVRTLHGALTASIASSLPKPEIVPAD